MTTIPLTPQEHALLRPLMDGVDLLRQRITDHFLGILAARGIAGRAKLSDDGTHIEIEESISDSGKDAA